MKKFLLTIIAIVAFSTIASAQFSLGFKAGVNFKTMNFKDDYMSCDMEPGFTLGAVGEVEFVSSLALDFSMMYSKEYFYPHVDGTNGGINYNFSTDYLNIPINIKWKFNIPAISKVVKPMIYTGPEMSLVLKESITEDLYRKKTIHFCWNIGAGVELFDNWQVAAHYGFGLTSCFTNEDNPIYSGLNPEVNAKQQYAVVTVAYLFDM